MVRRLILTLMLALTLVQPLAAQIAPQPSEIKPPDVPAFNLVIPQWKADGTLNVPIDPTVTPPPEGQGLTEVNPMTNTSGRIITNSKAGATFNGYISGTTLTITDSMVGTINVDPGGDYLFGSGVTGGTSTRVVSQSSGTAGGIGVYTISTNQGTIGSAASPVALQTTAQVFCLTTANNGPCAQAKFRTVSNCNHSLADDPERNYSAPAASHRHEFFGNRVTNAYTTYATTRTRNKSDSAGFDANATNYWFPPFVIKAASTGFGDGLDYAVRCTNVTLYYQEDLPTSGPGDVRIPRGLRYVFGRNMDDPDNSMLQAAIYNLNQIPASHHYNLTDSNGKFNSQGVYNCAGATPASTLVMVNADGTDPFGGTCASGADFWIAITGAACWDGTNLWSPGGYSHVIKQIYDNGFGSWACPYNYYRIPFLHQEIHFTQQGWTDRQRWRLASDDMMQTKLDSLPICTTSFSNAPCANGATFQGYISGTTLTVTSVTTGALCLTSSTGVYGELGHNGNQIEGTGITGNPVLEAQPTGTACQTGTYTLSVNEGTIGSAGAPVTLRASGYVANGRSIHEDWLFGWDNATIEKWEFNCIGVEGHTPHECDTSQIDATERLNGGATGDTLPDGTVLNANTAAYPTSSAANMFPIPTSSHGPMTEHTNKH